MAQLAAAAQERHGIAIRVADGLPYSADRIHAIPGYVEGEAWRCSGTGCSARMIPCAWKREGKKDGSPFKVPPHFRAEDADEHIPGCRPIGEDEGDGRGGEPQFGRGAAHVPPNRVRFRPEAPVSAPDTVREPGGGTAPPGGPSSWKAVPRETRETSVPHIGPVCDAYAETVLHHSLPLRVDECGGRRYNEVIRPLPPRGLREGDRRIFYGKINLVRLPSALRSLGDGPKLDIPLWNVGGKWRVLEVGMDGWGADRKIFLDRLWELVRRDRGGAALHYAPERVPVIFFLGEASQWWSPPYRADRFCAVHALWVDTWLPGLSGEPPRPPGDPEGRRSPLPRPPRPHAPETVRPAMDEGLSATRERLREALARLGSQRESRGVRPPAAGSEQPIAVPPAPPPARPSAPVLPLPPPMPPAPPPPVSHPAPSEPPTPPAPAFPSAFPTPKMGRDVAAMVRSVARSLRRTIFGR